MGNVQSDAMVFFGATGDLAYKRIFPSLQGMVKRGQLNVPVIGVAKAGEQSTGLSLRKYVRRVVLESPLHRERTDYDGRRFRCPGSRSFLR